MRLHTAICLALILACTCVPVLSADNPSVEKLESSNGWINWERQVLKAVGHGVLPGDAENVAQAKLMARSAAVADAYRNLASVANGVRVTGDTYVKNFVTESDEVRLKVEGFIHGAEVVSEKQLPDRSYEVILQMPLAGEKGLVSALIPSKDNDKTKLDLEVKGEPSGLIIDARGLEVRPSMSPKVYDEDGREVYGTVGVSPDYAIESGIAVFPRSMEQAMKSSRTGGDPLIFRALKRGPKFATDLIISNRDAERVRNADKATGILHKCRVAILIGPADK